MKPINSDELIYLLSTATHFDNRINKK